MANYGYSVGDATPYTVYRFVIPNAPVAPSGRGPCPVEVVRTITLPNQDPAVDDLEGVGTSPRVQRIVAVTEAANSAISLTNNGRRVNNIDRFAAPDAAPQAQVQNLGAAAPTATNLRMFSDTGTDFYVNSQEAATQFILQGDIDQGSKLYKTGASGNYGNTTLTQVGTQDVEFADGLAILNTRVQGQPLNGQYTGEYIAIASDFYTTAGDGDGEEIYFVDLDGPDILGNPIQLVNPNGTDFNVLTSANASGRLDPDTPDNGFDSGLAFTPDGRLIALTENGILYEITNFQDDRIGLGDSKATIRQLCVLTLNGGDVTMAGANDLEGLGIVSETATGAPIFSI